MQQLEHGLILKTAREATPAEREGVALMYAHVFGETGQTDSPQIGVWARHFMSGQHPTMTLDDTWLVVDPARDVPDEGGSVVSAINLIPQMWQYGGGPEIGVGRIEIVATHRDYRNRRLVRYQFDAAHRRSAELGHLMQVVTGIPHYYRRFGYTMALELGASAAIPLYALPKTDPEHFTLRLASTDADYEQVARWNAAWVQGGSMGYARSAALWRYENEVRTMDTPNTFRIYIITRKSDGEGVGFIGLRTNPNMQQCALYHYVMGQDSNYIETYSDVMAEIRRLMAEFYDGKIDIRPDVVHIDYSVPREVCIMAEMNGGYIYPRSYAFYVRVPDVPAFIRQVTPVLEQRLEGSAANRYTGTFKIAFFNQRGVELTFAHGKLTDVVECELAPEQEDASFPYDTFINVLMGHRTREELQFVLPESWASGKGRLLLNALFPRMPHRVFPQS